MKSLLFLLTILPFSLTAEQSQMSALCNDVDVMRYYRCLTLEMTILDIEELVEEIPMEKIKRERLDYEIKLIKYYLGFPVDWTD